MNIKFRSNKYTNLYYKIINNRILNPIPEGVYTERHHILPRCAGGDNLKSNIVGLTGREHYICHRLLPKMVSKECPLYYKFWNAFAMLCWCKNDEQERDYLVTSKIYESCKKNLSDYKKKNIGNLANGWSTKWIFNIDIRQNKRIPKELDIPAGWYLGRVLSENNWKIPHLKKDNPKIKCKECGKIFERTSLGKIFCSRKCGQSYVYKKSIFKNMKRGDKIIKINRVNVHAYKKCGYTVIN